MSVSSVEGSPIPGDLQTKYQKLANEYAKLRAQVSVLKKAVVEEQTQNREMKDALKDRDQILRKTDQEMDSLNFRNQQLTKRVSVLQEELENTQNKKKIKNKGDHSERNHVDDELQKQKFENSHLMSLVQEQSERYESEKSELNRQLELYEYELKECKNIIHSIEEKHKIQIAAKEAENHILIERISRLTVEVVKPENGNNYQEVKPRCKVVLNSLPIHTLLSSLSSVLASTSGITDECNIRLGVLIENFRDLVLHIEENGLLSLNLEKIHFNMVKFSELLNQSIRNGDDSSSLTVQQSLSDFIVSLKEIWQVLCDSIGALAAPNNATHSSMLEIPQAFQSLQQISHKLLTSLKKQSSDTNEDLLSALASMCTAAGSLYKILHENSALFNRNISQPKLEQEIEKLKRIHSKKVKELEEQIASLSGTVTPQSGGSTAQTPTSIPASLEPSDINNQFGRLSSSLVFGVESDNYEAEVRKFLRSTTCNLVTERQAAEGIVTVLRAECNALKKRLEDAIETQHILEVNLTQSHGNVSTLQEELNTTTSSYEIQMASMSEHLANMNERVATQEEEIQQLRHMLASKDTKKGRPK